MRVLLMFLVVALAGCTQNDAAPEAEPVGETVWTFAPTVRIQESTGREMSLAVDPNNDERLFACSPTGTGVVGRGENHSDFWLSEDGGQNWTRLSIEPSGPVTDPGTTTDLRSTTNEGGDCDVAIAPDGSLWTVDSWLGGLAVSWSADGAAWDGTALAAQVPIADRPWIRFDAQGRLHMTYQDVQFGMPTAIWYTATDDGSTWTRPTSVTTAHPDGVFSWTGDFVVSADGQELHSILTRRNSVVVSDPADGGPEQVWIAQSTDGGATWSSEMMSQRAGPSSFLYPSLDMDDEGGLHAVWSEARATDQPTFYTYQAKGGAWTEPVALGEGLRTGAPWVAAYGVGQAHVLWSGSPDAASEGQRWWFYVASVDAPAQTWETVTTTTEAIWNGTQPAFPEFNEIQVDAAGRPMIVAVAPCGDDALWCPYFQRMMPVTSAGAS